MSIFPPYCPACEEPVLPDHNFCGGCRHPLRSHACAACGTFAGADGYCEQCGLRRPSDRDHMEIESGGAAGVTNRGLRHSRNEDAMALTTWAGLAVAVICDGVSTSPRPDDASSAAAEAGAAAIVEALRAGTAPEEATHAAVARAAAAAAELATSMYDAPACTYVSAITGPDRVTVGWVGDSRAYWLPDEGSAILLTEDDVASPGVLTAWLGADAGEISARTCGFAPQTPGMLVICSDGLWGYLPDPPSLRAVLPIGAALDGARVLLRHALDAGGRDNITVVLIPVEGHPSSAGKNGTESPTTPSRHPNRRIA